MWRKLQPKFHAAEEWEWDVCWFVLMRCNLSFCWKWRGKWFVELGGTVEEFKDCGNGY